mgnify:CR=1 FL=1
MKYGGLETPVGGWQTPVNGMATPIVGGAYRRFSEFSPFFAVFAEISVCWVDQ